jgi:hypothetical protein
MAIQSSFPRVADQIINYNKNIVDILTKLNSIATTKESSIQMQIFDETGNLRTFSVPSNESLRADIERLNNNINSLYSIDSPGGSLVQNPTTNQFKKIISVDLNVEPSPVNSLSPVVNFKTDPNWFFDSMLDPLLSVEFDLGNQIEDNVRKIQSRRYIIDFAKDSAGELTTLGQSALESFNLTFNGATNIEINAFESWHKTTPGVVEPNNPRFDEQVFDLLPNSLLYDGIFTIINTEEDRINRKLYYVLNTLNYRVIETGSINKLAVGDILIVNLTKANSKYKIVEINNSASLPRVRFERVEGFDPIAPGNFSMKLYSPVNYRKKVRISIGYDERNVIFVKPINADLNLVARDFSFGTGFYTNELLLSSTSNANGLSLEQFYIDYVYDYGQVLKDLVAKKTPNSLAGTPNAPTLDVTNFKVVQVNQHLTNTPESNVLKAKHNILVNAKSELEQLQTAIVSRTQKLKITKFPSLAEKKKVEKEIADLSNKESGKSKQIANATNEILSLSKNPNNKVDPKFRLRGFWSIPEAVATRGTRPQEVVQFVVQYRYLSKDGRENPIETYKLDGSQTKAAFSNWSEYKTDVRKRGYDKSTGEYYWQIENVESAETPNINQIDIPIQANERVELRIKSISEVGWPESPAESDYSEIITVDFPDDLNNVLNENDFILQEATKEDLKVNVKNELSAKGLDEHLSEQININGKVFHHETQSILSGFKDDNGLVLNLFEYLTTLQDKIKTLEDKISRAKGVMEIVIFRNNQEFVISNGSETVFNVECEDYLESYQAPGAPTGRIYQNNVYVIKDFVVRVRNKNTSPLGLLSNRTYLQNSQVYSTRVPQIFWVNDKDELLTSDISGSTKTQVNYQYLWSVNYDTVSETTVTQLAENIGNNFTTNNSITSILSNNEFNLGYNETGVLSMIGNNKSLLEPTKWTDNAITVASTNKLLTTIHPVIADLEKITETNSEKVKIVNTGENNDVIIPINIYFKMNALDNNQSGANYAYIDLNSSKKTIKHIKKVKFFLENEAENRPFTFSIKFNINRNKIAVKKISPAINTQIK